VREHGTGINRDADVTRAVRVLYRPRLVQTPLSAGRARGGRQPLVRGPLHGPGFEPDDVRDGVGLQNMRDRLGAVGGRVTIASEPGDGTRIAATVPLTDASARSGPTASKPSTPPV
jgi:hypothetical protein